MSRTITLSSGVTLTASAVSSADLLRARTAIVDPEVPRFFIADQNRWVDNPHHPDYIEGVKRANQRRGEVVFEELLRRGCRLKMAKDQTWLRRLLRYSRHDPLVERLAFGDGEDLKILYLYTSAIDNEDDVKLIVESCCLIESRVHAFMRAAGLMRGGVHIDEAGLRFAVDTGIASSAISIGGYTLVAATEEYSAATAANLNWSHWRSMRYSLEFMEETIAYHRIRRLVDLHSSDAQQAESHRKAKQK